LTGVLIDSSVWVSHFRQANSTLQSLLAADQVLCHPLILIELACGTPPAPRERTLDDLRRLKASTIATTTELLALIEDEKLAGSGCGAVDVALLAAARLTPDTVLWTVDKNLDAVARRLHVAYPGS
jgi:predicted nucleic acid-binding protein